MKILSVVSTRPELIKMSSLLKKLDKYSEHVFVHTGQNYDYELNEIFYKDLGLRKPDYYLDCGVGRTPMEFVGELLIKMDKLLKEVKPDAFVVLGDTNGALSAIVAKRQKIPIFHLESGNRCFDDNVPEEINRRILDHLADINVVYTENQRHYLLKEGLHPGRVFVCGSPMGEVFEDCYDEHDTDILKSMNLKAKEYYLVSIHRDENTEIESNFLEVLNILNRLGEEGLPVIVSTHPRTRKHLDKVSFNINSNVQFCKPFGFLDYLTLQTNAKCVISDSGTISEESSILDFPAVTIRNAIERPESIDVGNIVMSGLNADNVMDCINIAINEERISSPEHYRVYNFSERILKIIFGYTNYVNKFIWYKK